jgi:hypothetical protein
VPALNLFSTLWGMFENPLATSLRIGRSEQKNYTHLLFALCGPLLFALILFAAREGNTSTPFGYMLLGIIVLGPLLGLLFFTLAAFSQTLIFRISFGVHLRYRDIASSIAWSMSPLIWASVLILPIQLGVFGLILFSTNPAPWIVLPLPFWLLGILDVAALVWSMLLFPFGLRMYGPPYRLLLIQQVPMWLLLAAVVAGGSELLRILA